MDSDAGGYDKQALKAMIERKRQNDFVRKREFDQLRKLRNRDPGALANMARPSFFQTSLPSDVEGRAVTLKKIDEIEAQMSRQWWKSKSDGGTDPHSVSPQGDATQSPSDLLNSEHYPENSALSAPFASTRPNSVRHASDVDFADDFLPTQMASDMASVPGDNPIQSGEHSGANVTFSTSRLFAIEVDEMETDPELEEAAIRFANGDDGGAEKGLLAALRGRDLRRCWICTVRPRTQMLLMSQWPNLRSISMVQCLFGFPWTNRVPPELQQKPRRQLSIRFGTADQR
jgi:hypothetical protein